MATSDLSVFKQLNARMRWLTDRQAVISQNVANVDTPGYQAREMKPLSFRETLGLKQPQAADGPKHFKLVSTSPSSTSKDTFQKGQETTLSGNSVDLEHELKKSADTALEYQTMSHLYRKHMEMLRMAVRGNGGA